jgi:8-oxo-dGTP pyrophosphatase MutT (NUDIX family)
MPVGPLPGLRRLASTWRDRFGFRADRRGAARQAGAIPYTVVQGQAVFLLITSRRTGRWIFPKGSLIDGLAPWEVAAHEAFEEAGVEGDVETRPIGSYQTLKTVGIARIPVEIDMFPLKLARQFEDWPEKGSRHRHWVILPEARRLLSEPGLVELVSVLNRRILTERQPATSRMIR